MSDYEIVGQFDPSDVDAGDAATLRALAQAGSDLSRSTHFIHFLTFDTGDQARAAGRELNADEGYRVRGYAPDDEVPHWSVRAEIERVPSADNVRAMRAVMVRVAVDNGGAYDGWEAAVQS